MQFPVNPLGRGFCGSRGDVGWKSCDAVEWFCVGILPIVPLRCIHAYKRQGMLTVLPIRWSFVLVARTFLGRWLWAVVLSVFAIPGALQVKLGYPGPILYLIALALVGIPIAIALALHLTDGRNRKIRRVLGDITIGNCDPANFTDETLQQLPRDPKAGYATYAEAVARLLTQGRYARAMWTARLCVATEGRALGEALTDEILNRDEVEAAIKLLRKDRGRWAEIMLSDQERAVPDEMPNLAQSWSQRTTLAGAIMPSAPKRGNDPDTGAITTSSRDEVDPPSGLLQTEDNRQRRRLRDDD